MNVKNNECIFMYMYREVNNNIVLYKTVQTSLQEHIK